MKVTLLRRYNERLNLSMKLYADRLRQALEATAVGLQINDFSPRGFFPLCPERLWLAGKIQDYSTRLWSYPRQLKKIESDIFHIVDHANAYLASNLDMRKAVITCHDLMVLKFLKKEIPLGYEKASLNWPLERISLWSAKFIPKARGLIAVSEATKSDMVGLLGCRQEDIRVINYSIDPVFNKIEDQEGLFVARNKYASKAKYVLLNIGSKNNYKNFSGLLRAFNILVKRYGKDVFLIKVGLLSRQHLGLIRKFNLGGFIRIIPELMPAEINYLYNLSDVFVFPSLYEGFGWPTVEAMACGLAVVSSDKGGLREAVEDAAYIIDPYDAQNIADGIIKVLEDAPTREALIAKGFNRIRKLDCSKMASQTYQVYQKVNKER